MCEKCHMKNPTAEPVIEFKAPLNMDVKRFDDYLPYLKVFLVHIAEGKCKVHFNEGFKK